MTFQVINLPSAQSSNDVARSQLLDLIQQYRLCSDQLEAIADIVPTTLEDAEKLDRNESQLHDQRAELLGEVTDHDPKSLDDVKALLQLWRIEKVDEQTSEAMTVTDSLILKICDFLEVS